MIQTTTNSKNSFGGGKTNGQGSEAFTKGQGEMPTDMPSGMQMPSGGGM